MVLIKYFATVIMCFENLPVEIYGEKIASWILKLADIHDELIFEKQIKIKF